jgi:hypothetical protein
MKWEIVWLFSEVILGDQPCQYGMGVLISVSPSSETDVMSVVFAYYIYTKAVILPSLDCMGIAG